MSIGATIEQVSAYSPIGSISNVKHSLINETQGLEELLGIAIKYLGIGSRLIYAFQAIKQFATTPDEFRILLDQLRFGPRRDRTLFEEILLQLHGGIDWDKQGSLEDVTDRFKWVLKDIFDLLGAAMFTTLVNYIDRTRNTVVLTPVMQVCLWYPWGVDLLLQPRAGVTVPSLRPHPRSPQPPVGNALLCVCCSPLVTFNSFERVFNAALAEDAALNANAALNNANAPAPLWRATTRDGSNMLHLLCNLSLMNAASRPWTAEPRVDNCMKILKWLIEHRVDIINALVVQRDGERFLPAACLVRTWTGYHAERVADVLDLLLRHGGVHQDLTVPVNVFLTDRSMESQPPRNTHLSFLCVQRDFAPALEVVLRVSAEQQQQQNQQQQQQLVSPFVDDRNRTLLHAAAFANAMACFDFMQRESFMSGCTADSDGNSAFHHLALGENSAFTLNHSVSAGRAEKLRGLPSSCKYEDRTWMLKKLDPPPVRSGNDAAAVDDNTQNSGIDWSTLRNRQGQLPHEVVSGRRGSQLCRELARRAGVTMESELAVYVRSSDRSVAAVNALLKLNQGNRTRVNGAASGMGAATSANQNVPQQPNYGMQGNQRVVAPMQYQQLQQQQQPNYALQRNQQVAPMLLCDALQPAIAASFPGGFRTLLDPRSFQPQQKVNAHQQLPPQQQQFQPRQLFQQQQQQHVDPHQHAHEQINTHRGTDFSNSAAAAAPSQQHQQHQQQQQHASNSAPAAYAPQQGSQQQQASQQRQPMQQNNDNANAAAGPPPNNVDGAAAAAAAHNAPAGAVAAHGAPAADPGFLVERFGSGWRCLVPACKNKTFASDTAFRIHVTKTHSGDQQVLKHMTRIQKQEMMSHVHPAFLKK